MPQAKLLRIALLFAPLALLSACGTGPAYDEASQGTVPLYTYNPDGTWNNSPDNPDSDPDLDPNGSVNPSRIFALLDIPAVSRHCKRYSCLAQKLALPTQDWHSYIPVPIPEPAPYKYSQIVFDDKVYQVMSVETRSGASVVSLRQIGNLVAKPVIQKAPPLKISTPQASN